MSPSIATVDRQTHRQKWVLCRCRLGNLSFGRQWHANDEIVHRIIDVFGLVQMDTLAAVADKADAGVVDDRHSRGRAVGSEHG